MENVETTVEAPDVELSGLTDTGNPEPEAKEAEPEIPEYRRIKHKVKVDDEELEVDYDDLVRDYQMKSSSSKRFEEAKKLRGEAETFLSQVKSNPAKALKELQATEAFSSNPEALMELVGKDAFIKLAEDVLYAEIQKQKLSPEQQELADLKQEKAKREEEEKKAEDEKKKAEEAEHIEGYRTKIESTIVTALEGSGLPKNPETVARMSKLWLSSLENGYEPDPGELVTMVKESYQAEHKNLYSAMSAAQLYDVLGEAKMKELREFSLSRVKTPTGGHSSSRSEPREYPTGDKKMTMAEVMKQARQRAGLA